MPKVNQRALTWARETAGLTEEEAARKLRLKPESLLAIESGLKHPTRSQLTRMSKEYRRPLVTFYLPAPPPVAKRGEDYRLLPGRRRTAPEPILDALLRDVRVRQCIVRATLEDAEEDEELPFVGSAHPRDQPREFASKIITSLRFDLDQYRSKRSIKDSFSFLRSAVERTGVFVLLQGNLGSYHTAIKPESFRGYALSDPVAPFIVINEHDSPAAWPFTLLHELSHVWLGRTGVSGEHAEVSIEKLCNDVASLILLPEEELREYSPSIRSIESATREVLRFAEPRRVSGALVAYRLFRTGRIDTETWTQIRTDLRNARTRETEDSDYESGPNYYTIRKHRVGPAIIAFTRRMLKESVITPSRAARILGVHTRSVDRMI